jgi:hypothetical protein
VWVEPLFVVLVLSVEPYVEIRRCFPLPIVFQELVYVLEVEEYLFLGIYDQSNGF